MPGNDERDAARARLKLVRERFASRLRERVVELAKCVGKVREGTVAVESAISLAHRLADTAGSFGYSDAGAEAAIVADLLRGVAAGDARWDELHAAIERLRATSPQ